MESLLSEKSDSPKECIKSNEDETNRRSNQVVPGETPGNSRDFPHDNTGENILDKELEKVQVHLKEESLLTNVDPSTVGSTEITRVGDGTTKSKVSHLTIDTTENDSDFQVIRNDNSDTGSGDTGSDDTGSDDTGDKDVVMRKGTPSKGSDKGSDKESEPEEQSKLSLNPLPEHFKTPFKDAGGSSNDDNHFMFDDSLLSKRYLQTHLKETP